MLDLWVVIFWILGFAFVWYLFQFVIHGAHQLIFQIWVKRPPPSLVCGHELKPGIPSSLFECFGRERFVRNRGGAIFKPGPPFLRDPPSMNSFIVTAYKNISGRPGSSWDPELLNWVRY